jgi:hypothetical protein
MGDDLPIISLPSDSTKVDSSPARPQPRGNTEVRRAGITPTPAARPPAATNAHSDPRKASEMRRPGSVTPVAPKPEAADEDDPEKLLREYAERQKSRIVKLEHLVAELRKAAADRDLLKARVDTLEREVAAAKRQVEAAAKSDEVIRDLQGKIDAAILANSMLTEEKEKLKKGLSQQTENLRKAEERASQSEKALAEAQKTLAREGEARKEAETRVAAALQALQGHGEARLAEAPARPAVEKHNQAHAAAPRPSTAPLKK